MVAICRAHTVILKRFHIPGYAFMKNTKIFNFNRKLQILLQAGDYRGIPMKANAPTYKHSWLS